VNPTLYDILGVRADASAAEIKRAWREATDRFEPGSSSGQFRMYNEAADVLLDPRRRAEYDATLEPAAAPEPETREEPAAEKAPVAPVTPAAAAVAEEKPAVRRRESRRGRDAAPAEPVSRRALVLTAVLAVLAVALLIVVGWLGLKVRAEGKVADARTEAPAAAEQAAKAMLSYDYRTLPADRQRASGYLTSSFAKKYLQTFRLLEKNKDGSPGAAVQTKTVVSANAMGSGVVDASENKARVLVYVNQTSRKEGADPQVFQNRVTMTMVRQGDRWLVSDLKSY
jgi:Mce-associated membrane protein